MASPDQNTSSARPSRLLIVDDDPDIAALIVRYFGTHGFGVVAAADGNEMRRVLAAQPIDVVLLDLGLPGEDGLELTRYLREHWHGAVIIVTGRGESVDRVVGLELGADDYVTKPFDLRELLARIRSVLRRIAERSTPPKAPKVAPVFRFGEFRLDPATRELRNARGELIVLTTGEYDLLIVLLEHPNRVLSRDDLMTWLHGRDMGPYDRAIDVQIGRLRRKIEVDAANALIIKSVRGAGYLFATPVQRE
jgi:two-component system OmpR family response regulator